MKPCYLPLLLCLLAIQSCSLEDRLAATSSRLEQQYADLKTWDSLPLRTISWDQAVAMMKRNNFDYINTVKQIEKAEREELSVYTDLIPGASYYAHMNKALGDMTKSINSDDLSQNLNITFYLPTLTQIPYRVYASKATTFAARKSAEGKERELISELYALQRRQDITNRQQELEKQQPEKEESAYKVLTKDDSSARWNKIAALLGDYSARWNILPDSVPKFKWSNYKKLTGSLDQLIVCKLAMELEQARMRQYSIALRYLPTINLSLYSPSLFSTSGGTYSGTFLDKDDTKLNMSLSYTFDTKLHTWNSYRDSKDEYERKERAMVSTLMNYKETLTTLRSSLDEYFSWRSYMSKQIDHLSSAPTANAAEFIQNEQTIHAMKKELLIQEAAVVESEAALILLYGLR